MVRSKMDKFLQSYLVTYIYIEKENVKTICTYVLIYHLYLKKKVIQPHCREDYVWVDKIYFVGVLINNIKT